MFIKCLKVPKAVASQYAEHMFNICKTIKMNIKSFME